MSGAEIAQIITSVATLTAAIGAVIIGIRNNAKIEAVHVATNSMKDQLVEATAERAKAEGIIEGQAAERLNPMIPAAERK